MLNWGILDLDEEAKNLAVAFLNQRTVDESLIYRGMLVSLAGAFEQFVRRLLRDGVHSMSGTGVSYDSLDQQVKDENIYRTGIALQTIREPLDYMDLDYELLATNLATCVRGSDHAILNAAAFAVFLTIISPKNLTDALRRIGMTLQWDDLGRMPALQKAMAATSTRETAKAVEDFLKRFAQNRNKIAHTGSGGLLVTAADFEQLLTFFRAFAQGLARLVESELTNLARK